MRIQYDRKLVLKDAKMREVVRRASCVERNLFVSGKCSMRMRCRCFKVLDTKSSHRNLTNAL